MLAAIKLFIIVALMEGLSSSVGGIISLLKIISSKKIVASLYEITAGIMTSIVFLDMIPESIEVSNTFITILFILIGIFLIAFLDYFSEKNCKVKSSFNSTLIILVAMLSHNITEGIAIGAGCSFSLKLGVSIGLSMFLHNIPEGIVVGISMKDKKVSFTKIIFYCFLVGMPTGIGAFLGSVLGDISTLWVSISLAFSAGAMLYIIVVELIPSSKKLLFSRRISLTYTIGVILGILFTNL